MCQEVLEFLQPERGGVFVDCTLGLGGHAAAILEAAPAVRLVGIDRDPEALELAEKVLQRFAGRVDIIEGEFSGLEQHLERVGTGSVDGIIADLGVSSLQLDTSERGFSFMRDGPLDMRMGASEFTARDVVNEYSEAELRRVFSEYGEERQARRIARAIVAARSGGRVESTVELRGIIHRAKYRKKGRSYDRIDPATRVFQALRIEVNQELSGLGALLEQAAHLLAPDGRLVVISYHSLEDRIVKNQFRELARGEIDPVTGRSRSESRVIEVLTKKPARPQESEVAVNPRARSAKLRAARRI
jgi:16S rRNA (cytosine1402-N4)-methyltransferase